MALRGRRGCRRPGRAPACCACGRWWRGQAVIRSRAPGAMGASTVIEPRQTGLAWAGAGSGQGSEPRARRLLRRCSDIFARLGAASVTPLLRRCVSRFPLKGKSDVDANSAPQLPAVVASTARRREMRCRRRCWAVSIIVPLSRVRGRRRAVYGAPCLRAPPSPRRRWRTRS
jgi:hypothetical protein